MNKLALISALSLCFSLLLTTSGRAQQLYNLDFDRWSKSSGVWNPYPSDAPASRRIWDTANRGLSALGVNLTTPEYKHVAVPGEGKAAVRVESKKVLWAFVAGNLYTGRFVRVVDLKGAEIDFGTPFTGRPKSLSGYVHYIPKTIDFAREPYLEKKGKTDEGYVEVLLTDWDGPYHVNSTKNGFINGATDPHVVGRGVLALKKDTGGYVPIDIPIEYRNGKTPKYVVIIIASSRYGGHFTGASGSVLYADEFRFNY